jgi:hypothetical protein
LSAGVTRQERAIKEADKAILILVWSGLKATDMFSLVGLLKGLGLRRRLGVLRV